MGYINYCLLILIPTAIRQLVYSKSYPSEMDKVFLGLTMRYTSSFIPEMIKSIGIVWNIESTKDQSRGFIDHFANQLYI